MPEFLNLLPPDSALAFWLGHLHSAPQPENIDSRDGRGRVTFESIRAPHSLPSFPRSTVDGYAVRAADTHGASESLPAYLAVAGEVVMGKAAQSVVGKGQSILIHTGGMLPAGADAVVMLEYTQAARPGEIEVMRPVAGGENIVQVGEDVREGQEVIPAGTNLRPAEIGGLMALGITSLRVARRPKVGILSTGDEVIPPWETPQPGQVRDVNAYTLSSLVSQAGGQAEAGEIVPDLPDEVFHAAQRSLARNDLLVITAGSSASTRDLTAQVIAELGEPGVLVHGVNVKPGKPTILGVCEGKAVVGLPGNPVSALVIASIFVVPAIQALLGLQYHSLRPQIQARLSLNLSSQAGREDWIAVRLIPEAGGYRAEPVFGQSNLIFTLAHADGLLRIPADATGLSAGSLVEVELF